MAELIFKNITEGDLELLRKVRNLPEVRREHIHSSEIEEHGHRLWFESRITAGLESCQLVMLEGRVLGFCRIKRDTQIPEVGYFANLLEIKPPGIGVIMNYLLLTQVLELEKAKEARARVLSTNTLALKTAYSCGWSLMHKDAMPMRNDFARFNIITNRIFAWQWEIARRKGVNLFFEKFSYQLS